MPARVLRETEVREDLVRDEGDPVLRAQVGKGLSFAPFQEGSGRIVRMNDHHRARLPGDERLRGIDAQMPFVIEVEGIGADP